MLNYLDTQNALHMRTVKFSLQEYMFVVQVVLGEDIRVAYASVFDPEEFRRNVPSEDEEDYLSSFKLQAEVLLQHQSCKQLREYIESEYKSDIQSAASNLKDYSFTGSDIQQLLANLLHNRAESLDDASVKDIVSLIKSMVDSGAIENNSGFEKHFITIPSKYNTLCPNCNREGYAVEGLDFRCEHCGHVAKWSEEELRYYPQMTKL